jgi:hypothetical protein
MLVIALLVIYRVACVGRHCVARFSTTTATSGVAVRTVRCGTAPMRLVRCTVVVSNHLKRVIEFSPA